MSQRKHESRREEGAERTLPGEQPHARGQLGGTRTFTTRGPFQFVSPQHWSPLGISFSHSGHPPTWRRHSGKNFIKSQDLGKASSSTGLLPPPGTCPSPLPSPHPFSAGHPHPLSSFLLPHVSSVVHSSYPNFFYSIDFHPPCPGPSPTSSPPFHPLSPAQVSTGSPFPFRCPSTCPVLFPNSFWGSLPSVPPLCPSSFQ